MSRIFAATALLSLAASLGSSQTAPAPLQVIRYYNITSATQVIDNRSNLAQSNYVSFLATGTGVWSVTMQYSDVAATGPWTSYGTTAAVTSTSSPAIGYGNGYHKWISFSIAGSVNISFAGCHDFFIAPGGGSEGGGTSVSFPITIAQGGTNASDAPTATSNLQYLSPDSNKTVPVSDTKKLYDWVSLTDYGAVGDCVTDDSTAIQNALNSSRYIIFPPPPGGCYLITKTLIQARGDYVYGLSANSPANSPPPQKPGVTIKLAPHSNRPMWETFDVATANSGNEFYGLENIVFDGNGANQDTELTPNSQACVDYRGTFILSALKRVEVTNCFGTAMFNNAALMENVWLINNTSSTYSFQLNPGAIPGFGGFSATNFFVEESMAPKAGRFHDAFSDGSVNDPTQYGHAIFLNGVLGTFRYIHCESALTCVDFKQSQGLNIETISADRIGNPSDPDPTNQYLIRMLDLSSQNFTFTSAYYDQVGTIYPGSFANARVFGLANGVSSNDVYQTRPGVSSWPFYTYGLITQSFSHAPFLGERPIIANELWIQGIGSYSPNVIRWFNSANPGDSGGPDWFTDGQQFSHETGPFANVQQFILLNAFNTTDNSKNSVTIPGPNLALASIDQSKFTLLQTRNDGNLYASGNQSNFLWFSANSYFGLNGGNAVQGSGVNLQGLSNEQFAFRGGLLSNVVFDIGSGTWKVGAVGGDYAAVEFTNGATACIFNSLGQTPGSSISEESFLANVTGCFSANHNLVMGPVFSNAAGGYSVSNDDPNITGSLITTAVKFSGTGTPSCTGTTGRGTQVLFADATMNNDRTQTCGYQGGALQWQIPAYINTNNSFTGNQDFSLTSSIKPMTVVTSAPSGACTVPSAFETNSSAASANVYECIGGVWSPLVGGGGGGGVSGVGATLPVVSSGGSAPTISVVLGTTSGSVAIGNDVRFLNATSLNGTSILGISGIPKLASGTPSAAVFSDVTTLFASGSCLGYLYSDGTCSTPAGAISSVSGAPSGACAVPLAFQTDSTASSANIYECIAGTWQAIVGGSGGTGVTSVGGTAPVVSSGGMTPVISVTVGTAVSTLAAGNDSRFLNATSLNGNSIASFSGIAKFTAGAPSATASSDVIGLFASGSCSGYLKSDGTCSTPTGTVTSVSSAPAGSCPVTAAFQTNTTAAAANLYECIAGNWSSLASGGGGGGVTSVGATAPLVSSGGLTPTISATVGSAANTLAAGNDVRFLNATKLNGTSIATFSGIPTFSGGFPTPAIASSIVALFGSGTCSGYLKSDGTCSTPPTGGITSLTGDVTAAGSGAVAATLATVNVSAGTCGDATHSCQVTTNGKGLVTAQAAVSISGSSAGSISIFQAATVGATTTISGCSSGNPCLARINGTIYPYTANFSFTITGSATETANLYIDGTGKTTLEHSGANTYALTGFGNAVPQAGSGYPAGTLGVFHCAITAGAAACVSDQAVFSVSSLQPGAGTMPVFVNGLIQINNILVPRKVASTSSTDVVTMADQAKIIQYTTGSGNTTTALPQPGILNNPAAGFFFLAHNYAGPSPVVLQPIGSSINGLGTFSIPATTEAAVYTDGANWFAAITGIGTSTGPFNGGTITTNLNISNSVSSGVASLALSSDNRQFSFNETGSTNANPDRFSIHDNTAFADDLSIDTSGNVTINRGNLILTGGTCTGCGGGGGTHALRRVTANDTATTADDAIVCTAASGSVTETMPAAPSTGEIIYFKRVDNTPNNSCTLAANSGQNIEGVSSIPVPSLTAYTLRWELATSTWWLF